MIHTLLPPIALLYFLQWEPLFYRFLFLSLFFVFVLWLCMLIRTQLNAWIRVKHRLSWFYIVFVLGICCCYFCNCLLHFPRWDYSLVIYEYNSQCKKEEKRQNGNGSTMNMMRKSRRECIYTENKILTLSWPASVS